MSVEEKGVRFGIFGKILTTMLIVALIPLGVVWYLDYTKIRSGLQQNVEQRLLERRGQPLRFPRRRLRPILDAICGR